jgi:hypothetical protein
MAWPPGVSPTLWRLSPKRSFNFWTMTARVVQFAGAAYAVLVANIMLTIPTDKASNILYVFSGILGLSF